MHRKLLCVLLAACLFCGCRKKPANAAGSSVASVSESSVQEEIPEITLAVEAASCFLSALHEGKADKARAQADGLAAEFLDSLLDEYKEMLAGNDRASLTDEEIAGMAAMSAGLSLQAMFFRYEDIHAEGENGLYTVSVIVQPAADKDLEDLANTLAGYMSEEELAELKKLEESEMPKEYYAALIQHCGSHMDELAEDTGLAPETLTLTLKKTGEGWKVTSLE